MPEINKLSGIFGKFFAKDRKLKLIVLAGIAGMVLILISQSGASKENSTDSQEPPSGAELTAGEYTEALEGKLGNLIGNIKGVGRVQIMITLSNSGEYIYAQEEKKNVDKNVEPGIDGSSSKTVSKENIQQSYILVESGYGQKEALVKTRLEPKIQGVVIICEGADNILVRQSLINVVTTALNIPTTRVCVEKIS